MLTIAECLVKADQLGARAAECEPGSSRDDFNEMGRQWRSLASKSVAVESLARSTLQRAPTPQ